MAKTLAAQRRSRAEEVCWSLMLALNLGGLDEIPLEWRSLIADPLQAWCDLAVKTGEMKDDE